MCMIIIKKTLTNNIMQCIHTLIFKCWIESYLHAYVITILLNVFKGGELKVLAAQGI